MRGLCLLILSSAVLVVLQGCASAGPSGQVLRGPTELPPHILIMRPDIVVRFRSAPDAPTLPDPKRTADAQQWAANFIVNRWSDVLQVTVLSEAMIETAGIQEHIGLYYQVAAQAFDTLESRDYRWRHKAARPDYSIGPGLSELGQEYGAEALLIVVGQQTHAPFALKLLDSSALVPAALTAGLVDLNSGRIMWLNYLEPDGRMFDNRSDLEAIVKDLLNNLIAVDGSSSDR